MNINRSRLGLNHTESRFITISNKMASKADNEIDLDLANWMKNLPTKLHTVPLNQLSLPGSHDSGAFFLDKNSPVAPDEGKTIKNLVHVFGHCAKNIIYKWSITQNQCFAKQMEHGIRYFDMRVAYESTTKEYTFLHGLFGQSYQLIFKDINEFLNKHPKEIVILDFNHLYIEGTQHAEFLHIVKEYLGDKMYGPGKLGTKSSLSDIWETKKQVIALYDDKGSVKSDPKLWSQSQIYSPWFNTAKATDLINQLDKRFNDLRHDCYNVFQAILTPQTSTIVWHAAGSLKTTLALDCDKHVNSWLDKILAEKKKGVNIVICDFVCASDFASKVVALNHLNEKSEKDSSSQSEKDKMYFDISLE